jgi:hypothetical protein
MKSGWKLAAPASAALLALLATSGCQKKTPQAEELKAEAPKTTEIKADPLAKYVKAYGFASRIPGNFEAFSNGLDLGHYWDALKQSHWVALINKLMNDAPANGMPSRQDFDKWYNDPTTQEVLQHSRSLFGTEFFSALAPGGTDTLLRWRTAFREAQFSSYESALQFPNDSNARALSQITALAPHIDKLEIPPLLFGFRVQEGKDKLNARIAEGLAKLPPSVQRNTFQLDGKYQFTSLVAELGKVLPPEAIENIRKGADNLLKDPALAKTSTDSLLSRRIDLAYGWVDDYLIVSVGTTHDHLKLAATPAESIVAQKAFAHTGDYVDKHPMGVAFQAKDSLAKIPEAPHLDRWVTGFKKEIEAQLSPEAYNQILADAQRLEAEASVFIPKKVDDYTGVSYWQDGLHMDGFGGIVPVGMANSATPLRISPDLQQNCFLWGSANSDPETSQKIGVFCEDIVSTAWQLWQKYGISKIPANQQQQYAMMEQLVIPKLQQGYAILQTLGHGLGTRSGFYVDFNGKLPALPNVPPEVAGQQVAPRLAYIAELKDRAAVTQSAAAYDAWVNDIIRLTNPQLANVLKLQTQNQNGVERYFYALPVPTGEHLPHVAIASDRWMLSTSTGLTDDLAKAATFSGPAAAALVRLNLGAGVTELQRILEIQSQTGKTEADKKNAQQALSLAIPVLKPLPSVDYRGYEENGEWRSSAFVEIHDIQ